METKTPHPVLPEQNKIPVKPHHEEKNLELISGFNGKITEWIYNKDYVYDGFILQTETEELKIKFPPHLGNIIKTAGTNNPEISLKGILRRSPQGEKTVRFVSMQTNDSFIDDVPPTQKPAPDTFIKGSGKVTDLQYGPKDDINGYIIDNQYVLKIPPHIAEKLNDQIQPDSYLKFTGMQKTGTEGEIKANNYISVHTKTISVNDEIEYLIK